MTKEEILNYVMNTPDNTNRMVLNDMIDELVSSSGGGSSLIPITIDNLGQNPSIEANEVLTGLNAGLRYEISVINPIAETVVHCGELRKCLGEGNDAVEAFAMAPTSGTAGTDLQLTLMLVGIRRVFQDGKWIKTWYVSSGLNYLSIGYYDG